MRSDIDTKFPGRIAKLLADEGDVVKPGQVVAVMDTRNLEASLKKSEALVRQAERSLDEAKANLVQQQTQVKFAQQEIDRTSALVPRGFDTAELLDQQTSSGMPRLLQRTQRPREFPKRSMRSTRPHTTSNSTGST
jgi:multidrug resistance efflux pump